MVNMETRLSLASLDTLIKRLELKKRKYPEIAVRIIDRLVEEMLQDVYADSYKLPTKMYRGKAEGGIRNDQPKWVFHEYGTGIMGMRFPHVSEVLRQAGWEYDVNQHGDKGWWYPTTESDPNPYKWTRQDGQVMGWTKGLVAERAFYDALQRAKERFIEVGQEELERGNN